MTNVAVIVGELSSPPDIRLLDSGSRLVRLQMRTGAEGGGLTSVPVAVWDPPAAVAGLEEGDAVVVVGRVERHFFKMRDGGTGSRVEVVATTVAPAGDRRRTGAALRKARAAIEAATG